MASCSSRRICRSSDRRSGYQKVLKCRRNVIAAAPWFGGKTRGWEPFGAGVMVVRVLEASEKRTRQGRPATEER